MKTQIILFSIFTALVSPLFSQEIVGEFQDLDNYSDFSVYGLSKEKTLNIFQAEFEDEMASAAKKYLKEGETLTIHFTDIDMAGDIQPWRNHHNADIRYIEDVYPPRLKFSYTLKNKDGDILKEGNDSLSDMSYQMNTLAPMRTKYLHFFYENDLLKKWIRKTLRKR